MSVELEKSITNLEVENAIVHIRRHVLRNGHHDLHAEEARLLNLEADLERVLECAREEDNVLCVVAAVRPRTNVAAHLKVTLSSHSNASITSRSFG